MINDIICGVSLGIAAGIGATVTILIIRWLRDNRKPGCHCWACRRLNKAESGDRVLALELDYHFHLWATRAAVEPQRERS